jgi:hypothetical protein
VAGRIRIVTDLDPAPDFVAVLSSALGAVVGGGTREEAPDSLTGLDAIGAGAGVCVFAQPTTIAAPPARASTRVERRAM